MKEVWVILLSLSILFLILTLPREESSYRPLSIQSYWRQAAYQKVLLLLAFLGLLYLLLFP